MQTTTVTKVLLSNSEILMSCAHYMEKNGIAGAMKRYKEVQLQYFDGVVSATLEVETSSGGINVPSEDTQEEEGILDPVEEETAEKEAETSSVEEEATAPVVAKGTKLFAT